MYLYFICIHTYICIIFSIYIHIKLCMSVCNCVSLCVRVYFVYTTCMHITRDKIV